MRKTELARRLAKDSNVTPAEAADQLDIVTHQILQKIRNGKPAALPGLGKFNPDRILGFQFESEWESENQKDKGPRLRRQPNEQK